MTDPLSSVPTWSGDPSEFEAFSVACRWYEKSLKDSERKQAASRVWARLQGPAKAVVRHCNPDDYESTDGLTKLIEVLRKSPLQELPIPDSFKRLDIWHQLKRSQHESIAQLLVREEDLFTQLQQSLQRARLDRGQSMRQVTLASMDAVPSMRDPPRGDNPPSTPAASQSQSPLAGVPRGTEAQAGSGGLRVDAAVGASFQSDFFSDELRGYRLLKAARLSQQERQNILTQTANSTSFELIRRALRTLFAEGDEDASRSSWRKPRIWWNEEDAEDWQWDDWSWEADDPGWLDDASAAYWQSWDDDSWYGYDENWPGSWPDDEMEMDENGDNPESAGNEETQYREAFAIAAEAQRTLAQARDAVKQVRQARGYFAPESASGKGLSGSPASSPASSRSKGSKGKSPKGSKGVYGPCLICGMQGHFARNCPDQFAKGSKGKYGKFGKSKGKKGFNKGKGFGKPIHALSASFSPSMVYVNQIAEGTRVVIDTGASENAVGWESLQNLLGATKLKYDVIMHDKPTFRFGNGQQSQAKSRVDIFDTSIGDVSFYVLGDGAHMTPPLLGGKTLRKLDAVMAYQNNLFIYKAPGSSLGSSWFAVKMQQHPTAHVSIDLAEKAELMDTNFVMCLSTASSSQTTPSQHVHDDVMSKPVFMMSDAVTKNANIRTSLSNLAQRLQRLRDLSEHGRGGTMCSGRPSCEGVPVLREAPAQAAPEPICAVDDMSEVRHSHQLQTQEGLRGRVQADGTTPQSDSAGIGAAAIDNASCRSHREGREWQADGVERDSAAKWPDSDHGDQHGSECLSQTHGLSTSDQDSQSKEITFATDVQGSTDTKPFQHGVAEVGRSTGSEDFRPRSDREVHRGRPQDAQSCCKVQCYAFSGDHGGDADQFLRRGKQPISACGDGEEGAIGKALRSIKARLWNLTQSTAAAKSTAESNDKDTTSTTNASASFGATRHGVPTDTIGGAVQFVKPSPTDETDPSHKMNAIEQDLPRPGPGGGKRRGVAPNTAKKLARSAAVIGAMVTVPFQGLLGQLQRSDDFMEIACAPTSALTTEMENMGFKCSRINYISGYDLESKAGTTKLAESILQAPPKHAWVSLPCTRLSSLTNLTQRDEVEQANFDRRVGRDLRRADEVASGLEPILADGGDVSWEWPTNAKKGWKSRAIMKLQALMKKHGRHVFWCVFHGCAYGLEYNGWPVQKSWTVMTTNRHVWLALQKRCPGGEVHEHVHCRGIVAKASSYYPAKMVKAVTKAIVESWQQYEELAGVSVARDVEVHLLGAPQRFDEEDQGLACDPDEHDWKFFEAEVRQEQPHVLALTRNRFGSEPPTGKRLEQLKAQLLRVHRASGHTSMASLQRLLKARNAPSWAVELAGGLSCPDCTEARRPVPGPVASLHETPGLMEIVGSDVFEFDHGNSKFKFILFRDRASGFVMTQFLQRYGGDDEPKAWEPTSTDVLKAFSKWLMVNPAPKWWLTDSATYFTSQQVIDFAGRSGMGLLTTPAESHEMLGAEEGCIRILKAAVARLMREEPDMEIPMAFDLAAHGSNQSVNASGFSAFQWVRGASSPLPDFPLGVDVKKAFGGMLKLKEKARVAFEMESAKSRLSRLSNAAPRPSTSYKQGQLLMLWRQRNRPGKVSGMWVGPVRLLLQEGQTLWLATGATLIRARLQQVRSCTRREELQAALEGTAILQLPVTVDSLLQSFTGRNFSDVTGEVPSPGQLQDNVVGADVRAVPQGDRYRPDSWKIEDKDGKRWLVRIHSLPRLALFTPSRTTSSPLDEDSLVGTRITTIKGIDSVSADVVINDDFKTCNEPNRVLQNRWIGETRFEVKSTDKHAKQAKLNPRTGQKRKANLAPLPEESATMRDGDGALQPDTPEEAQQRESPGGKATSSSSSSGMLPHVAGISPLTTALRDRGAQAVDGVPARPDVDGTNHCPVPACCLQGGHAGPHQDQDGATFTWSPYNGRVDIDVPPAEDVPIDETHSSSESSSSEDSELVPDPPRAVLAMEAPVKEVECFYALEIPVDGKDLETLTKSPQLSSIWLSRKMLEKGKERRWSQMSLEEKKGFDLAQAKELTNVLSAKALRSLTEDEHLNLDPAKVMQMRWVLTVKNDGTYKSRLVVLGFQQANIAEVQVSAPTMAKLSRNLVLLVCANYGFLLKSGDVTSAFLQALESLEDQNLVVWAPAELAVLFGADPHHPVMPLKITKAFYGLVQSPRCWFMDVCKTMKAHGWQNILADRCVFVLYDGDDLIGIAGLHVDDFLLGGLETHPKYVEAEKMLMNAYKWGKWQQGEFEFAGCNIRQLPDRSIRIDQSSYVTKWLDEVPLKAYRAKETKSPLTPREISQVRGVIGTLSWKATQTGPHFLADVSMLLSEIPFATVNTVLKLNRLVREVRREAHQFLTFPRWNRPWYEICIITWCDAGQQNRPDKSSTLGVITGAAPMEFLAGSEETVAIIHWRSSKTPRQVLGSNGAEVQSITEGEDATFKIRAMWAELHGVKLKRNTMYTQVRDSCKGGIVMDSRGIFDAMVRNVSSLHGLRSSRAGYELTLSVQQAIQVETALRWVNGLAQLADCLTKANERKVFLRFLAQGQLWRLVYDEKFEAGRKMRKRELEASMKRQEFFLGVLESWANLNRWPWELNMCQEPRNMGDASTQFDDHVPEPFSCSMDS